jgi:hypothetical protein
MLAAATASAEDLVVLKNGDRISGLISSKGKRTLRLQTPHGVLTIPLEKIDKVRREDGTEESFTPAPKAPPTPPPPPVIPTLKLAFSISGKTFWQAWDEAAAPEDPTLRLELRLDDRTMAVWSDAKVDPDEIPKAVVNSFSFTPDALRVTGSPGVKALPPSVQPGRIELALELPANLAGSRRLRLAYQGNAGSTAAPEWRDLVLLETPLVLQMSEPNAFRVEQDRGRMEFSKKRMKSIETFSLALKLDTPTPEP